jgi:hypothetical protein
MGALLLVEPSFDFLDAVAHVAANANPARAITSTAPPVDRRKWDSEERCEFVRAH